MRKLLHIALLLALPLSTLSARGGYGLTELLSPFPAHSYQLTDSFPLRTDNDFIGETACGRIPHTFKSNGVAISAAMFTTSILYNDNQLDKSIVKMGSITSPRLKAADYMQYSPAGILLALKLTGVDGSSDWTRMIIADVSSAALMTGITNGIKYTVKRERPDGRAHNSYPSGHTATSFMCASMLHKEYGGTVSPLIGLVGYGIASTTGIFRTVANRHWCSDVMAGAAIGILSTEAGYWLTDLLLDKKGGKTHRVVTERYSDPLPLWRFSMYSDYSLESQVFTSAGYGHPDARPACSIGLDASWLSRRIGVGPVVRAGVTQMKWTGADDIFLPDMGSVADVYTVGAGVEAVIPILDYWPVFLNDRLTLQGQAIAGYSLHNNCYSFLDTANQPIEWEIPAGMHYYANLGITCRTSEFSSVTLRGSLDYYDKVWRSYTVGAAFNFIF